MIKKLTYLIIIYPSISVASWLCKEAASYAQNNYFYSCGVSIESSLHDARRKSLENAKEEFRSFCSESSHCKDKQYIVSPMRTDCSKQDNEFICYRGLEYKILNKKQDINSIELDGIKEEIKIKERKLKELQEKYINLQYLNQLDNKINEMENMEKLEIEISELKETKASINNKNKGKAGFQIFYTEVPLSYGGQKIVGLGLEHERLIFSDILGIRFNANYVLSPDKEPEINPRGEPNSTSSPEYHSHKGIDVNVSVPIHIKNVSIAPKFGHTSLKYQSTTKSYNNFGIAKDAQVEHYHFDDSYIGVGIRYENRFFIEVEPRKYMKNHEEVIKVGVGIVIGF